MHFATFFMCYINSESQLWDLIETWGFCEDIKDILAVDNNDDNNNNNNDKDSNDDKSISALGLHRDMGFLRGHQERQGHRPNDDDDDEEEDDDEVEENDKDNDDNKDGNDEKSISPLGLDRDMGFLGGHQGHCCQ